MIVAEAAPPEVDAEEVLVFDDWKPSGTALKNRLNRVLKRLGIEPWPKPWQNLRTTRANELVEHYPEHVAYEWMGHTEKVAREHYLQVAKEHMQRAANPEAKTEASKPMRSRTRSTRK